MSLAVPAAAAPTVDLQASIYAVQQQGLPALVNIQPITESFTRGERTKQSSVGSGFLIDPRGYIVTNYHVAGKARRLMVTLSNKERIEAELVGEDPSTDLAVIRIPEAAVSEHGMKPLRFAEVAVAPGQFVVALGSPLALARTATFGIVSNAERALPEGMTLPTGERTGEFNTWIQTDAAINPGNSGGPLVDLRGDVVGVNARGASFADNIGFAIPTATARRVVAALIERGEVERSYAGVAFQPLKDWEGLFAMAERRGALVAAVEPNSPAAAAGLIAGDIVLRWADAPLSVRFAEELPSLYQRIAETPVGADVTLSVLRRGVADPLDITLRTVAMGRLSGEKREASVWGFAVQGITDQMVFGLDLDDAAGVYVEGVKTGGAAARGGLRRGQVIVRIEDRPVTDLASFEAALEALGDGRAVLLVVRRGDRRSYVLVAGKEAP